MSQAAVVPLTQTAAALGRALRLHRLKCDRKWFLGIWDASKGVELRKNDRGFEVGDLLLLCEMRLDFATGRQVLVIVTSIIRAEDGPWLRRGYVALSIRYLPSNYDLDGVFEVAP